MIKTHGLTHIHLVVRDLDRSLRFYREAFGMKERFRVGTDMVFLSTPGSRDLITLNRDESEVRNAGRSGGIAHFGFRLVDRAELGAAINEIEAAGGKLLSRSRPGRGRPYAYVADPDGYVIELEMSPGAGAKDSTAARSPRSAKRSARMSG
jgi:catechol 2,3-dioxygenase-like lactoylglutathione lyase family enzyme